MRIAVRVVETEQGSIVTMVDDRPCPGECGPGEYRILERRGDQWVEVGMFGTEIVWGGGLNREPGDDGRKT